MTKMTLENDGLLKTARLLCLVLRYAATTVAVLLLAIGLLGVLAMALGDFVAVPDNLKIRESSDWLIVVILLLAAITLWLSGKFLQRLVSIIDTVAEGDPFVEANAERLVSMAWFSLAITGLTVLLEELGAWYDAMQEIGNESLSIEGAPEGILLSLVLFILARVFRHGAAMRADLEGTV